MVLILKVVLKKHPKWKNDFNTRQVLLLSYLSYSFGKWCKNGPLTFSLSTIMSLWPEIKWFVNGDKDAYIHGNVSYRNCGWKKEH